MATRILIVKLSSLGDVLHALPAAQALRATFPEAHLAWAVERTHAALLEGQTWLDEVIIWDRTARGGLRDFVRRLRVSTWDLAIDLQGLFRSGLVTWLSGARERLGAWQSRELARLFYSQTVTQPTPDRHAVEKVLQIVAPLGAHCPDAPLDRPYLRHEPPQSASGLGERLFPLYPSQRDRAAVDAWLRQQHVDPQREPLVIVNPDCRREANRWPLERFAMVAQRLALQNGVRVAVTGGPAARPLGDILESLVGPRLLRADGQFSLLGSAELFRRAAVLLTGDTGPMHIAAAVDLPIVALLGPTSPVRTGPYTRDAVVINKPLECAPCLAKRCRLRHRPSLCMTEIGVDEVARAVLQRVDSSTWQRQRASA